MTRLPRMLVLVLLALAVSACSASRVCRGPLRPINVDADAVPWVYPGPLSQGSSTP